MTMLHRHAGVIVAAAILALAAVTGWNSWQVRQHLATVRNLQFDECVRVNATFTRLMLPSLRTLPRLAYYQQHPDELVQAIKGVRAGLALVAPATCGK